MNETTINIPSNQDEKMKTLRMHGIICYALMILGIFSGGVTSVVGVIWAYVKRKDANETVFFSHFNKVIKLFWISFGIFFITLVITSTSMASMANTSSIEFGAGIIVSGIIGIVVGIYCLVCYVKGIIRIIDNKVY